MLKLTHFNRADLSRKEENMIFFPSHSLPLSLTLQITFLADQRATGI